MSMLAQLIARRTFTLAVLTFASACLHAGQSTIQGWGSNFYGQLGNADLLSPHPALVSNVSKIAAGGTHTLALLNDGTVKSWGGNDSGQLGIGSITPTSVPVQVGNLSNVAAIAGGGSHSLALRKDGTVWTWGSNASGQLGNGTTTNSPAPMQVSGLSGITAIAGGDQHSLALKGDGTVWAWGLNASGQLGDGSNTDSSVPIQVTGLANVSAIACGNRHSLVVKSDGTVWTFGSNSAGQLGIGTGVDSNVPVQVPGIAGALSVGGGGAGGIGGLDHSVVLKTDGTVWSFGSDTFGELGDGNNGFGIISAVPVQVSGLTGITAISCGRFHNLALKSDSTVFAWGDNRYGELGDGTIVARNVPIQIGTLSNITGIACGMTHSLALNSDGTVTSWGNNDVGELGNGSASESNDPIPVQNLIGIKAASCGTNHSIVLKNDGTVWAFGDNSDGQLGNGGNGESFVPVQVNLPSTVKAISARDVNNVALMNDGTVWAWGNNTFGQLGIGSTLISTVPVQVLNLSNVTAIACGGDFSLALKADGTVWGWGSNLFGELAVGKSVGFESELPIQIPKLSGITAIACGSGHSLALKSNGTILAFGRNANGQLGIGSTKKVNSPTPVKGLKNVTQVACGSLFSMAIATNGIVFSWGSNSSGELGNNKFTDSSVPIRTLIDGTILSLAGGDAHALALKSDGSVFSWGANTGGQFGRSDNLQVFDRYPGLPLYGQAIVSAVPRKVPEINGAAGIAAGFSHSLALIDSATFPETYLNPSAVLEQQPIGTQFGFFRTTDPSGTQRTFTYSLVTGAGDTDNASFTVSGNSLLTAAIFEFEAQDSYTIRVRTTDNLGAFVEKSFLIDILGQPNSGADGVKNIADGNSNTGTVVNPINDLAITVARSNGGVITLLITTQQDTTGLEATTEFDDTPGRQKTKIGFTPSHRYTQKGIYVAKVTVRDIATGNTVAMGRKMINIDASETGMPLGALRDGRFLGRPPSTRIMVTTMKGTFFFSSVKTDTVKYVGTFSMPSGLDLTQSNSFSFGIGNVIIDMTVDESGKVIPVTDTSHKDDNGFFSKLALKVAKLPRNKITNGGELATFTATVAKSALSLSGFDTEGITNTPTRDGSTDRRIQVSYNLNGISYEDSASVKYILAPTGDFGSFDRQR